MAGLVSEKFSFSGWSVFTFLKGRRRMVVTAVATVLGYVISDSGTVAVLSGAVVEAGFALAEYFLKEY